jgi:hypothetical protein
MKNIHVLPTDKPSRLHTYKGILNLAADEFVAPTIVKNDLINLNIYITSDEQITDVRPNKGKWHLEQGNILNKFPTYLADLTECKLVIITTDQELIKDGVQVIDDEFLQWFVKNSSCEEIGITFGCMEIRQCMCDSKVRCLNPGYEIIIPKEEPKQENCCTPVGQIKRYVDCIGYDRKPKQMSKQTAVEWVIEKYINKNRGLEVFMKAIQMEKEQIIEAYNEGNKHNGWALKHEAEKYYNETYKKDK